MREHAAQFSAAFDRATDLDQARSVAWQHTGAVAVAVDLDQGRDSFARVARRRGDRLSLFDAVHDNGEVDPLGAQLDDARELGRCDTDSIDDVAHASGGKLRRLLERRHRRRSGPLHDQQGRLRRRPLRRLSRQGA